MHTYSFIILLFFCTTAIASPLQPVDSASLYDFPNFEKLDPVSNVETDFFDNYPPPGLVEQTQPPGIPGISTTSQDTTGPSVTDSSLDAVQFQPSSPSKNLDLTGSRFKLAEKSPTESLGPPAPAAVETVYLCCESKGESTYLCDDHER